MALFCEPRRDPEGIGSNSHDLDSDILMTFSNISMEHGCRLENLCGTWQWQAAKAWCHQRHHIQSAYQGTCSLKEGTNKLHLQWHKKACGRIHACSKAANLIHGVSPHSHICRKQNKKMLHFEKHRREAEKRFRRHHMTKPGPNELGLCYFSVGH